ncbi:MAG: hypothetical protein IT315_00460 [Anaerolineales bacterium]|nr:hypothetical protein [Anaerolineales bacterium]
MATHAATMSSIHASMYARESDSFMRKLTILLLLVVNASLGIVLWFRLDRDLPLLLPTFFADACIGLIAGYGARFVYRNWNLAAQYITAILAALVGMILIGSLTKSVLGIGPLGFERDASAQIRNLSFDSTLSTQLRDLNLDPLTLFDFSKMEASDVAHLAVSLLLTLLSLQAWRQSSRQVIEVEPLGHAQIEVEPRNIGVSVSPVETHEPRQPVTWFRSPAPSPAPRPRIRTKNRSRTEVRKAAKASAPRKSRSRRRPNIQLAVVEEHRCPYCLDPVNRNDARGVQECDVCHTLHHADCWAITGFCQVPHLNS